MLNRPWFEKMGKRPLGIHIIPLLNSVALLHCLCAHTWLHRHKKRFLFLSAYPLVVHQMPHLKLEH